MLDDIGSKIRKLRVDNKDTLRELADKLDYDYSNLSKIERGKLIPSLDLLNKIADVYGVKLSEFFKDGLTEPERDLLDEQNLSLSDLKNKYDFVVDGVKATDEEIKEAIRLIRQLRD